MTETSLCPRDSTLLEMRSAGPTVFHACPECQGLWIERRELSRFLSNPSEVWRLPQGERSSPIAVDGTARCTCPGSPLMKTRRWAGVAVDVCPECKGVWLDGDEIDQLLAGRYQSEQRGSTFVAGEAALGVFELLGGLFSS